MLQNYTSKDKTFKRPNFSTYKLSRRSAFEDIQEIHIKIAKWNTNAATALLARSNFVLYFSMQYFLKILLHPEPNSFCFPFYARN